MWFVCRLGSVLNLYYCTKNEQITIKIQKNEKKITYSNCAKLS